MHKSINILLALLATPILSAHSQILPPTNQIPYAIICDELSRIPIAFARIHLKKTNTSIYTDECGQLFLPNPLLRFDTLTITQMGYTSTDIAPKISSETDTILLKRHPITLSDVKITGNKKRKINYSLAIGSLESKVKTNYWGLGNDVIALYIPNSKADTLRIKSIFAKITLRKQPASNTESICISIHETSSVNEPPGQVIYNKIIPINDIKNYVKNNILIITPESVVTFPPSGIYVSFQWMTNNTPTSSSAEHQVGLKLTASLTESFTWVKLRKPEPPKWNKEGTPYSISWRFPEYQLLNAMMGISVSEI